MSTTVSEPPAMEGDRRWDVRDVAAYLKVSVRTIRRMASSGSLPRPKKLPGGRPGTRKTVRWDPDQIRRWFDKLPSAKT